MPSQEKIYTCEAKRPFVCDGNKVWDWKVVNVADAIRDGDTVFRCKDCHGAVRVHRRHVVLYGVDPLSRTAWNVLVG